MGKEKGSKLRKKTWYKVLKSVLTIKSLYAGGKKHLKGGK